MGADIDTRDSKPQPQRRRESKARPASPGAAQLVPFKAEEQKMQTGTKAFKADVKKPAHTSRGCCTAEAATERKASAKAAAAEVAVACGVCVVVVVVCVS